MTPEPHGVHAVNRPQPIRILTVCSDKRHMTESGAQTFTLSRLNRFSRIDASVSSRVTDEATEAPCLLQQADFESVSIKTERIQMYPAVL